MKVSLYKIILAVLVSYFHVYRNNGLMSEDLRMNIITLCKIGDKCVVDPSAEEESCSVISLVVGVTGNPNYYCSKEAKVPDVDCKCSTISLNGPGSFAPRTFKDAINQGIIAAKCLDEALGKTLLREINYANGVKKKSYGFL